MMRKVINILLLFSLAVFLIGYPVWAMYYESSRINVNLPLGFRSAADESPLVRRQGIYFFDFPPTGNAEARALPELQSEAGSSASPTLILVNKDNGVAPTYVPPDLRVPKVPFSFTKVLPHKKMAAEAAVALEKLFDQAKEEGIILVGVSGYRPYVYQKAVHKWNVRAVGKKNALKTSAPPGYSEHQTGLAMDLSTPYLHYKLDERFGDTKAGHWIAAHASEFGFIIRYPQGKEKITGYQYEPWHIRFVGEEHARKIAAADLTLEEYLNN
ncbi:MAG TPA: M15 family metallopeptidase [Bacillota bacterium]|nr:M15 family metallopeptidase [Bacillota bacterium]